MVRPGSAQDTVTIFDEPSGLDDTYLAALDASTISDAPASLRQTFERMINGQEVAPPPSLTDVMMKRRIQQVGGLGGCNLCSWEAFC